MWMRGGFIRYTSSHINPFVATYETTAKGKAMIEALCNTEEPRQVWVDHNGKPLLAH
jgi:hypothetical protein